LTSVKRRKKIRSRISMIQVLEFDYSGPIDGHDFEALWFQIRKD
jgi:deoxyxylulose-5-phosphate synthase